MQGSTSCCYLLQLRPVHPFPFTEPLSQPLPLFTFHIQGQSNPQSHLCFLFGWLRIRGRTLRPRRSYGEWLDERYSLPPCQLTNFDKLQRPSHRASPTCNIPTYIHTYVSLSGLSSGCAVPGQIESHHSHTYSLSSQNSLDCFDPHLSIDSLYCCCSHAPPTPRGSIQSLTPHVPEPTDQRDSPDTIPSCF